MRNASQKAFSLARLQLLQCMAIVLLCLWMLPAQGVERIARFDQGMLRYSNWNAPYVTVDTCLDITVTRLVVPDTVYFSGRPYPVVEVGPNAFRGCAELTAITLGDSVKNILRGALLDCPSLRVLELRNPRPPHLGMHPYYRGEWHEVVERYHTFTTVLVVPPGSEQAYREAPGWGEFKVIQSTWPTGDELERNAIEVRRQQLEHELQQVRQREAELLHKLKALE